jgi:hypothetical protein
MRGACFHRAAILAVLAVAGMALPAHAVVLLAPHVRSTGVEPATVRAFELLLIQEIERQLSHGRVVRVESSRPCTDAPCAARAARRQGANGAVLCSVTRSGSDFVVETQRVEASGNVVWSQRHTARGAEALDALATPIAAGCTGRALDPEPVSQAADTTAERSMRHSWSTQGPRVGNLYPTGDAYAGAGRLTSLAYVWRYTTPNFDVESVPALGVTWGGDLKSDHGQARDWTLLDLFLAWTPATGEFAPYIGGGMGLHAIKLKHQDASGLREEAATALQFSVGAGILLCRNYDFQLGLDLRYRHFAHDFETLGGQGARGLGLSVGIQHR